MSLDPSDAMELTQLLQLIAGWLANDPDRLAPRYWTTSATPPTAWTTSAPIWTVSPSSSEATTGNRSSGITSHEQRCKVGPLQTATSPRNHHRVVPRQAARVGPNRNAITKRKQRPPYLALRFLASTSKCGSLAQAARSPIT